MVTVIIPIHNILKRGYLRVFNSCYSLVRQSDLKEIIIVDSSNDIEHEMLLDIVSRLDKIRVIRVKSKSFNKPLLLNTGIKHSLSEWVMCTDADYLFKSDFLDVCKEQRSEGSILFKEVKMLPNIQIRRGSINSWSFPQSNFNEWGHLANGACQYATRQFFLSNPYPEEMDGFGAMDNIMAYIAYNNGLKIKWITESEILHQYHKVEKFRTQDDNAKFKRNQKILADYIKQYKLPKLLKKTR